MENMSEINDMEEIYEGKFPISLRTIDQYQRKDPDLMAKLKTGKYKCVSICGGSNNNLNLITYEDEMVIKLILQS